MIVGLYADAVSAKRQGPEYEYFNQGNALYREGDYEAAIEQYERVLSRQLESSHLYFNLANAYYKEGSLGQAMLNYERALLLNPRESDINYNYKYIKNELELREKERNFVEKLFYAHIQFYSVQEMAQIITLLTGLLFMILILSKYYSWTVWTRNVNAAVLAVLIIIFVVGLVDKLQFYKDLVICVNKSASRFEPKDDSTIHYKLIEGQKLKIIREDADWYKIKRLDGKMGWVLKDDVEKIH